MRPTSFGRIPTLRPSAFPRVRGAPHPRPTSADAGKAMLALVGIYLVYLVLILAFAYGVPALLGRG